MIVDKTPTFEMLLRRMADALAVVVDVETSGLDWRNNHIIAYCIGLGSAPEDQYYVPVRHAGGGNLPTIGQTPTSATNWNRVPSEIDRAIVAALAGKLVVGHNLSFDLGFLWEVGLRDVNAFDTMIAAYLTDELRRSLSLAVCCVDEGVVEKKGEALYAAIAAKTGCPADKASMGFLWQMPGDDDVVVDYGCGDSQSTWQLWKALEKKTHAIYYTNAVREYSFKQVAAVEMALIPVLWKMSMRGVRIDEEQLVKVTQHFKNELEKGLVAVGDMNVRSPLQVRAYFEKNGVTNWPLTEKGAPSFTDAWLQTTEPGRVLRSVRKNRTLLDSFLLPMPAKFLHKGRVYCDMHQTRDEEFGTRTGRLSITNPNLGAMPGKRQGETGKLFRSIFIPDEGMEFTDYDYETQEIRICAHYCKAKVWVDGFNNGVDPHTAVAETLGINRIHAKRINLALMTGAGKSKMASELGLPMNEAMAVVEQYFNGLPELKRFQKAAAHRFESRGFVSTLLGRRLQLADRNKGYTAVNRLTQGGGADLIKAAMVKLDKEPKSETLLTIYDSALIQHEKGDYETRDRAANVMANVVELGATDFSIPMGVSYGSGMTWGEASFAETGRVEWKPVSVT